MFKIEIKNLQNVITNKAEFESEELCVQWLNSVKLSGAFGKLERQVKEIEPNILDNNEDISKSVSVEEFEQLGRVVKIHTLPQEFSHEITDISSEKQSQQESDEALKYLENTDWMIIREMDSGESCPKEIKELRLAARRKVL